MLRFEDAIARNQFEGDAAFLWLPAPFAEQIIQMYRHQRRLPGPDHAEQRFDPERRGALACIIRSGADERDPVGRFPVARLRFEIEHHHTRPAVLFGLADDYRRGGLFAIGRHHVAEPINLALLDEEPAGANL